MSAESERAECARLCEELSHSRSFEVKLFASELAGRIRARGVPPSSEKISLVETAKLIGVCKGRIAQLVYEGTLPQPDAHGLFDRNSILTIQSWIAPYMTLTLFDRMKKLKELSRSTAKEPK